MIELFVKGQAVDIAPNTKITLNFASNIFGDISKITPSNSLTISLPKTPKNESIFGVAMYTNTPYKRWDAELYINGVEVIDTAYLVLLSVSDTYEVALYWGVVTALQSLKDSDKTLADINEVLQITYGGSLWWNNWNTKGGMTMDGVATRNLINASYSVGAVDLPNDTTARTQYALLPSVKVSWLWNSVVADNGLNIQAPASFTRALKNLALPFATHNTSGAFNAEYIAQKYSFTRRGQEAVLMFYGGESQGDASYEVKPIYATIKLDGRNHSGTTVGVVSNISGRATCNANISLYAGTVVDSADLCLAHYSASNELKQEYRTNIPWANANKSGKVSCDVKTEEGDYIVFYVRLHKQTGFDASVPERSEIKAFSFAVECEVEGTTEQVMGGMINTRDNLPTIKQLDFIKALCAMYGLWATLVDGVVHLVKYAELYDGSHAVLDWSHKLVGSGDYDPTKTTYTLADYAQRNTLQYKEDDTVKVDASGALVVDNETLDKEKEMVTLPFSASDGDVIPHLAWKNEENTELEEQKVEQRIMELSEKLSITNTTATLKFGNLSFAKLVDSHYAVWQKIMRNPIVIEEKIRLTEIDIKELDYRRPIYLQKYGATFAIDKVQWSGGEPSSVTLVKLPPLKEVGVATPYNVTTGVTFGEAVAPDYDNEQPSWAYLVSGAGEYFAESATISFDTTKAKALGIGFVEWRSGAGRTISTENPYVYDGTNGDLDIYAHTADVIS